MISRILLTCAMGLWSLGIVPAGPAHATPGQFETHAVTTTTFEQVSAGIERAGMAMACSAPVSGAEPPIATDCLFILNVAVGFSACEPACHCAPKGTLPTVATDALFCLAAAVGGSESLACPCVQTTSTTTALPPTTTTTTPSTTITTTTTTIATTTTTTTSTSTTTTTLCPDVDADGHQDDSCGGADCDDDDENVN